MSARSAATRVAGATAATAGLVVAGAAAGFLTERRLYRRPSEQPFIGPDLGSLRGTPTTVRAEDGVELFVDVDDPAGDDPSGLTVVFVHGYALDLHSWHFQRQALRGRHRLVFYDHRSHGRSSRSNKERCTLEQLGADLRTVLDAVVPSGPVVLVGHSMGGMTIMALAEQSPELFGTRIVGTGLVSTSAGDLDAVTVGLPGLPGKMMHRLAPGVLAALARAPKTVESGRRVGSDLGYVLTQRYAFGAEVPTRFVEFTDEMLSATPIDVVAAFFPVFAMHDRYAALEAIRRVPAAVVCGTRDLFTPVSHSRELGRRLPSADVHKLDGAGHMVILERAHEVSRALGDLIETARLDGARQDTDSGVER
ncbi:MAG: alpha/beta fold hydrolase [Propionibacteriales bacterium]|nr:alpha/beta fold hydrolase [Propionibacteriales bacterium]